LILAINAGSDKSAQLSGVSYQSDQHATGGVQWATTDDITNTSEDTLLQSERFVEMAHQNSGERSFNVEVEQVRVVANKDIFAEVGHDVMTSVLAENIPVTDGMLSIALSSIIDNATLSGFAIYSNDGGEYAGTELFRLAVENGKSITFVGSKKSGPATVANKAFPRGHEGYSGWPIERVNGLVPSPALDDAPHIVLLHIGTNDMWMSPMGIENRLSKLIQDIYDAQPNALIAVASIIPWSAYTNQISEYNGNIPGIVKRYSDIGHNIIFVDQFDGFPYSDLADGIHPTVDGYQRMGQKWYRAIQSYLN